MLRFHIPLVKPDMRISRIRLSDKAWLFAGSENGARNTAILLGLIVSCKPAGVDPFAWLKDVLSRIPTHSADRVGELIPREWKKRFGSQTTPATPTAA